MNIWGQTVVILLDGRGSGELQEGIKGALCHASFPFKLARKE